MIKKVENTVPWVYVINYLNGDKLLEGVTKMNFKKQIKKSLELKKLQRENNTKL